MYITIGTVCILLLVQHVYYYWYSMYGTIGTVCVILLVGTVCTLHVTCFLTVCIRPYIIYMLRDMEIMEDVNDIRKVSLIYLSHYLSNLSIYLYHVIHISQGIAVTEIAKRRRKLY